MTNNIMTFNQVKCKHQHSTHAMKPNLCIESLGLSYQQVASQLNSDHDEPLTNHSWFHRLLHNPKQWSFLDHEKYHHRQSHWHHPNLTVQGKYLVCNIYLWKLIHGVTYLRTGPLSTGAAIDRFNTLYIVPTQRNPWPHTPIQVDQRHSDRTLPLP